MQHMTRHTVLGAVFISLLAGCGEAGGPEGPTPPGTPTPGVIEYAVTFPTPALGGILFSVPADEVSGVEPRTAAFLHHEYERDGILYVALCNLASASSSNPVSEVRIELNVIDTAAPPVTTVLQAIGPFGQQQPIAGHAVEPVQ